MKKMWLLLACSALAGCARKENVPPVPGRDTVTQVSLLSDFKRGDYKGKFRIRDLLHYGRMGIGTLDGLDGEMMVLNGRVYRFAANGDASEISPTNTTPSATITFFDPDITFDVGEINDAVFRKTMDWKRPAGVHIVAFRVTGLFDVVRTRSMSRQSPPFKPLDEIGPSIVELEWHDTVGTLVGFYFPDTLKEANWSGYHLHFIDKDLRHGGHVLSFRMLQGRIEMDPCTDLQMMVATNAVKKL